jgi:hypothetical protein
MIPINSENQSANCTTNSSTTVIQKDGNTQHDNQNNSQNKKHKITIQLPCVLENGKSKFNPNHVS